MSLWKGLLRDLIIVMVNGEILEKEVSTNVHTNAKHTCILT